MEQLKRARRPLRVGVTRAVNEIEAELKKAPKNENVLKSALQDLEVLEGKLVDLDQKIMDHLLEAESTDDEIDDEFKTASDIQKRIYKAKFDILDSLSSSNRPNSPTPSNCGSEFRRKNFKLPKIEIRKFNGELTEWLGFWAQFQKIHEDEDVDASDKFQYLVQSIVKGTRARDLVESYPQTGENYPKVIEALKDRFGKKKFLMQVYVRELLKMVIGNNNSNQKVNICKMFDRLESHLRALESLGVTTEQTAVFLFPMVESSLPEDILIAWQRSSFHGRDGSSEIPPKTELFYLMEFLKKEVEHEDQRALVQSGFSSTKDKRRNPNQWPSSNPSEEIPTAAGLHVGEKNRCVFCDGQHESRECVKAQEMDLEEKRGRVKAKMCCFTCLRSGHLSKNCRALIKCVVCSRRHPTIMCADSQIQRKNKSIQPPPHKDIPTSNSHLACSTKVILKTLMVSVMGENNRKQKIRVMLDDGSQRSYVKKSVAEELGLKSCGEEELVHALFGGVKTGVKKHSKFTLKLKNTFGKGFTLVSALDQEKICGEIPRVSRGPWMNILKNKKIWISDLEEMDGGSPEIGILLGADVIGQLMTGNIVQLLNGLTAVETVLGWTVMGRIEEDSSPDSVAMTVTSLFVSEATVDQLWSLETIGIQDSSEIKSKEERDVETKRHFLETVSRNEDGRYSVSLPWVDGMQRIPDNRMVAEGRLQSATRKLKNEGNFLEYNGMFKSWEEEGIIELVDGVETEKSSYYLPHRPVFKPESLTTPVRPVFDASCKSNRTPSLNECLEKGPNLLELIPTILLQFREKKIGIVADIRKAFQMIEMREEDRDFLRFLWWEDQDLKKMKIYRHRRVVFGVNCSPFLLAAVIDHHLSNEIVEKPTADKLRKSLYVDNCVLSLDSLDECVEFKEKATGIMRNARMDLRQWECGATMVPGVGQLSSSWCGLGNGIHILHSESQKSTNVLGLNWDKDLDTLNCVVNSNQSEKITKRLILSLTQRIFDPIGFTCPVTIVPKVLLQKLWKTKLGWDEEVPREVKTVFCEWWEDLEQLADVRIPRMATNGVGNREKWEIHTFCDASQEAFAAAVYLRTESEKEVSVQLLQAKARVAPMKKTSIPRLELISCNIAARLASTVKEALQLNGVPMFFWSDSTTALAWIRRNDNWGTFVGNRVKEICRLTEAKDWRHVPGILNPADLPSRGCNSTQLVGSSWWEGPGWLKNPRSEWPCIVEEVDESAVETERKKTPSNSLITTEESIPWYVRGSSFLKTVRIFAWISRFIQGARKKSKESGPLRVLELQTAERNIILLVQKESFPNSENVIAGIRVQVDDGLIRVKTKLVFREDLFGFKFPILLPKSHPIVNQLVMSEHIRSHHAGIQYLVGNLREKYWIIQSRRVIRSVLEKCVTCRRFTSKQPEVEPAPLPTDRIKDSSVFEVTGVDLAGPLILKDKSKTWIVLFTCAVYRAVHLELVTSLTTDSFLQSLRRFISRRGRPSIIYCDNGTNFVGSSNLLKDLDWRRIIEEFEVGQIEWKFNPPAAPWWGGWWERLVRSLKDLMKRNLGRSSLNYEELMTVLCDVEGIVNGRPLTYVTEDAEDLSPLTPSMFLQDLKDVAMPDLDILDSNGFQRRFRYRQKLKEELRARFRREYLGLLVQRGKEKKVREFVVGDVVLVQNEKKRLDWPLGRIMELIPGKDGFVRVARVKTSLGTILRPIQRLFPLEVSSKEVPILPNPKQCTEEEAPILPNPIQCAEAAIPKEEVKVQARKSEVLTKFGRKSAPPSRLGF